jgi:hypothetical protein
MVNYFPLFLVAQKTIITNLQQFRLIYYLSQNYLIPLFILFSSFTFRMHLHYNPKTRMSNTVVQILMSLSSVSFRSGSTNKAEIVTISGIEIKIVGKMTTIICLILEVGLE